MVEECGAKVSTFRRGDRIAGVLHGCKDSRTGAFAEYVAADANLCWKVPNSVPLEQASTMGVGWVSAIWALDHFLWPKMQAESPVSKLLWMGN